MIKKELLEKLRSYEFDNKILKAFQEVERENFLPDDLKKYAYEDTALPIGHGQTISQPYTIALMLKLLDIQDNYKVLEIGSGSGYVLSLLNVISKDSEIFGTEIIDDLYKISLERLKEYKNIKIFPAGQSLGLPNLSFDRILVSASAKELPINLLQQLNDQGQMVCPIQSSIMKITKKGDQIFTEEHNGFVFVPLIT